MRMCQNDPVDPKVARDPFGTGECFFPMWIPWETTTKQHRPVLHSSTGFLYLDAWGVAMPGGYRFRHGEAYLLFLMRRDISDWATCRHFIAKTNAGVGRLPPRKLSLYLAQRQRIGVEVVGKTRGFAKPGCFLAIVQSTL